MASTAWFILLLVSCCICAPPISHAKGAANVPTSQRSTTQNTLVGCSAQFIDTTSPALTKPVKLNMTTLCLQGFAVGYSQTLRSPLWSAEYLTRERLEAARALQREDFFHEERLLTPAARSTLPEYVDYAYDRGHLAPNFDMPTPSAQYDSFSLANVAPQASWHNRHLWADVERLTRYQVYQYDTAYVVTGVAYLAPKRFTKHGLPVPSHFFKVVYLPDFAQAGVYWSKNDDSRHLEVISLHELTIKTGLNAMPSLPNHIQHNALYLPTDVADPEVTLNFNQSADAAKDWWQKARTFFAELWLIIKQVFT